MPNLRNDLNIDLSDLNAFLSNQIPDFQSVISVERFTGGYSNLTFLLSSPDRKYVLRRPPIGANIKGGHDMGREFRILQHLQKANYRKIPKPLTFSEGEGILDAPFYVMEHIEGRILRAKDIKDLQFGAEKYRTLSTLMADNLAELHSLDLAQSGLNQIGKPEGYIERQVNGWHQRYEAAKTDDLKAMEVTIQWLLANRPPDGTPTLIHNDYKYDNVVFDENLNQIVATLDWEMTTIGDPLMDLGTALAYYCEPEDAPMLQSFNITWMPGNLSRQAFAARYALQTGRDISNLPWFYVFGLYKNAVVLQQIYSRWKAGTATDPRFGVLIDGVKALSEQASQHIR